jgi:peptidoglycan LD-endopeptidase LytH
MRTPRLRFAVVGLLAVLGLGACYPGGGGGSGETPCPVTGTVSFRDDFGDPRSGGRTHQGVDILAPRWRSQVAVAGGTVDHRWDAGGGGNGVFLDADDGTRYVYWHLQAFEGSERRVAPGDVIGYTGDTGNATGTHLHFEKRPNAGAAVNPYPMLDEACTDRS